MLVSLYNLLNINCKFWARIWLDPASSLVFRGETKQEASSIPGTKMPPKKDADSDSDYEQDAQKRPGKGSKGRPAAPAKAGKGRSQAETALDPFNDPPVLPVKPTEELLPDASTIGACLESQEDFTEDLQAACARGFRN